MDTVTVVVLSVFVLVGVGMSAKGVLNVYRGYRIWSNEPIPANGVRLSDGVVEVEGEVEAVDGNTFEAKYSGDEVHVYGQKKEVVEKRDGIGDANFYVGDGDGVPGFRITDGTEFSAVVRLVAVGAAYAVFGAVFAGVPGWAILSGTGVL